MAEALFQFKLVEGVKTLPGIPPLKPREIEMRLSGEEKAFHFIKQSL